MRGSTSDTKVGCKMLCSVRESDREASKRATRNSGAGSTVDTRVYSLLMRLKQIIK